jgi:hypothetical protein
MYTIAAFVFASVECLARTMGKRALQQPITVATGVTVVEGGALKEPWCIRLKLVSEQQFFLIDRKERHLALLCNLNMSKSRPWTTNGLIMQLQQLRNAKVDKLIIEHECKNDPLSDSTDSVTWKGPRMSAFARSNIPPVIVFDYPSFTTTDGFRVDGRTMHAIPTPTRTAALHIEFNKDMLEYLIMASKSIDLPTPPKRRHDYVDASSDDELPEGVKWIRRGRRRKALGVKYRGADGKKRWHTMTPPANITSDGINDYAQILCKFYEQNHVTPTDSESEDSDDDVRSQKSGHGDDNDA